MSYRGGYGGGPPTRGGYGAGRGSPSFRGGRGGYSGGRGGFSGPPSRGGFSGSPSRGGYSGPPSRGGYSGPPSRGGRGGRGGGGGRGGFQSRGGGFSSRGRGGGFGFAAGYSDMPDGKRMRKPPVRKTVDYNSHAITHVLERVHKRGLPAREEPTAVHPIDRPGLGLQTAYGYDRGIDMVSAYADNPSSAFCTKYVHTSVNKDRSPVNAIVWNPDARRIITGTHRGEFTLWNGMQFNFETILQAHESAVRTMQWTHDGHWLVSGDDKGAIKYWMPSLNNVKAFEVAERNRQPIREISVAPSDAKFVSCSSDQTVRIWDFELCAQISAMEEHGDEVRSVQWHPFQALLASGGKDSRVKLWDPRAPACVATLPYRNSAITRVRWNQNGHWLLSGSKDRLVKLWDIRKLGAEAKVVYRDHRAEVTALEWHPVHEELFVVGGQDGNVTYFTAATADKQAEIYAAHDQAIWALGWHPLGHVLLTGGNDALMRSWTRNRPGEDMTDKYNVNQLPTRKRTVALRHLADSTRLATQHNPRARVPKILADVNIDNLDDGDRSNTRAVLAAGLDDGGEDDDIVGLGDNAEAMRDLAERRAKQRLAAEERRKRVPMQRRSRSRSGGRRKRYDSRRRERSRSRERSRHRSRRNY